MNTSFDQWKKSFDAWEQATAKMTEELMKSPLMLGPSGAMLSGLMRMKKTSDAVMSAWWGALGLPTRHAQERTLHEIHRLQSKLLDLEEQLSTRGQRQRQPEPTPPPSPPSPPSPNDPADASRG